ncbi:MAG: ABC transporter substrate-binding protein [Anaerolineae bacterium]|nr:ABC transporter substrate-binding protein [Anaerolineae bacterium]
MEQREGSRLRATRGLMAAQPIGMLALCALLLAACRVPGSVRPTLKIGLVAPFEGRYRYVGYDLFPAVRLALQEANAAGGVGGFAVELVAYDDRADPEMAVEQARKLAVDPQVVAVIGHFDEATTAAAAPAYAELGLPLVAPGVFDPDLGAGQAGVFRLGPDADDLAAALLEPLAGQTAALVSAGGPLGAALLRAAHAHGVVLGPVVAPDDADGLAALLAADPSAVLCDADPVSAAEVVVALRAAGWDGDVYGGPALGAADFAAVGGAAAVDVRFVSPWPPLEATPETADFFAAYTAISRGPGPGRLAAPAYDTARLVLDALSQHLSGGGTPARAGMSAALASLIENGYNEGEPVYWYRIDTHGIAEAISFTFP